MAESQREMAIAKRKHREYEQHIGHLNENIQMMGRQLSHLRKLNADLTKKPEVKNAQVDTADMDESQDTKLLMTRNEAMSRQISRLLKVNAEISRKVDVESKAVQSEDRSMSDMDMQTEAHLLLDMEQQTDSQLQMDKENQTEAQAQTEMHVGGQLPIFNNSNCTINIYYK